MQSVTQDYGDVQLNARVAQLERENSQLKEQQRALQDRLDKALDKVRSLQAYINWENKLFATPSEVMSDAEKVVARKVPAAVRAAQARTTTDTARDDGLARVYLPSLSEVTGKSPDRVGATLVKLAEKGAIKREFIKAYDQEKGRPDNALYVGVAEPLMKAEIRAKEPRNTGNGQKNFVCKACHSAHTKVRRVYEVTCMDCGTVSILDASKKEDKAFIVDDNTAEHWDEWYGEVEIEEVSEEQTPVEEASEEVLAPDNIIEFPRETQQEADAYVKERLWAFGPRKERT